jgi:Flp pilus assembly protein TadG
LNGEDVVYRHVLNGAPGHALIQGGFRILYHGQTTPLLDPQQPRGAVVQVTGENDANNAGSITEGGRAEERVQGRPMTVLLGPTGETHMTVGYVQVAVGRGYVDPTRLDGLSIARVVGGK